MPIILDPSNPEIPATLGPVQRILRGVPATLSHTFYTDGSAIDPGSATVSITRVSDGLVIADEAATSEDDPGVFSYTLTPTDTALLDTLLVSWNATISGHATSLGGYVEIVGGFLFTVAEFRALGQAYANATNYPTAAVAEMRTTVEQALEDACDVAFVPRYYQETFSGTGSTTAILRWPKIREIRVAAIDDADVSPVSSVVALREGIGYLSTGWTGGYGNVTVGYEHGYSTPPARMKRAALILAKRWITPGSADDRAINVTTEAGTYALFQAGVRGHLFDVPEVSAACDQYSLRVGVA